MPPESRRPAPLQAVDSVQLPVPDLDAAVDFYVHRLGHDLLWRTSDAVAVRLTTSSTELVLQTRRPEPEVDLLVASVDDAVADLAAAGGVVVLDPVDIPVGRLARVADPFGNVLTLLDLSAGRYTTASDGTVTGVQPDAGEPPRSAPPAAPQR